MAIARTHDPLHSRLSSLLTTSCVSDGLAGRDGRRARCAEKARDLVASGRIFRLVTFGRGHLSLRSVSCRGIRHDSFAVDCIRAFGRTGVFDLVGLVGYWGLFQLLRDRIVELDRARSLARKCSSTPVGAQIERARYAS
jgi:hypothetical protein